MRPVLVLLSAAMAVAAQPSQPRPAQRTQQPQFAEQPPQQPCSLEGRVTRAGTSEPIRKAAVVVQAFSRGGPGSAAQTDAAGQWTIGAIQPGRYRIWAERSGYVRQEYGQRVPGRAGATITCSPGQRLTGLDIALFAAGVITGRVVDEDGERVMNCRVDLLRFTYAGGRKRLVPFNSVSTNDLGEYRLHSITPGRYYLRTAYTPPAQRFPGRPPMATTIDGPEYSYPVSYYPNATEASRATPIEVAAGAELRGMDFTLMPVPTVRVRGRVVGIPGRGTMISLIPADHGWFGDPNRRPGGVDQDGNFEFRGITPGAYILAAQHHADKQVWMGRLPVIVGNSHVTGLQLTMVAGTELSGLVRVAGDTAIQPRNLRIMLEPIDSTAMVPGSPAALKDDGTFVVPRIFPDTYRVSVFGLPEDHYLRTIRFGGEDQPSRTITTGPGASSGLELVISPGAPAIEGYVRNQEGQPVTGARVVLVPDGGPPDPVTTRMIPTESDGRFRMGGLIPGAYKVYAWEDIQEGEQYDPDLLKKYESSAKSVRLAERAQEVVDLLVIPSTARQGN